MSASGVTVTCDSVPCWLAHCYSVDDKQSNISASLHSLGQNIFASVGAKNYVPILLLAIAGWVGGQKILICKLRPKKILFLFKYFG